ncbi:MAG: prepilin peptidase [Planctomycetota bacterium]|nr:prepilin peptidase [Planctomycetota bacterium]
MDSLNTLQWLAALTGLAFIFALGAIVGSFLNVIVYRVPRGMNIITPPSACPACGTRLRWRQNFPIIGWILLRGRCRFCRSPISPEYPLVEFITALLFAALYVTWFMNPSLIELVGADPAVLRPEWARAGAWRMGPYFLLVLALIAGLIAMTLIDLKTFTIPVRIAWFIAVASLIIHPLNALWIALSLGQLPRATHRWTIPVPDWDFTIAALASGAGLLISIVLLRFRILPMSMEDYEQWEQEHLAAHEAALKAKPAPSPDPQSSDVPAFRRALLRALFLTGPAVALMFLGYSFGLHIDRPFHGMFFGMALGLLIGLPLRRLAADDPSQDPDPVWVQYPHIRREMVKEALFLALPILGAGIGWWIGSSIMPPWTIDAATGEIARTGAPPPLWLAAFAGSLLGALVGGGLIWLVRILGSLAFNKEAMGLGDVHLMFAVGAVLGWIDPTLAFFIAPFFGILWALASVLISGLFRREGAALPYGPHHAAATLLVLYAHPLIELGLSALAGRTINLP